MSELITLISQVGFPIGVSIFLLVFMQKTISNLTIAITELKEVINEKISTKV